MLLVPGCSLASAGIQFPSPVEPERSSPGVTAVPHPLQQHSPLPGSAGFRPRGVSPSPPEASDAVGSGFVEDPWLLLGTGFRFHKQVVLRATEWKMLLIGVNGNFAISLKISKILSPISS